ncbi:uncharacterized protein HKW66_Vig0060240 [Vigna angularis]|uniref:SAP domain-containing protein n=2 Tax=Phaseolus angularis TaxID=3914 RepID=A0A8T0L3P6_PHAAN|nr:uncharacterized protein LOC108329179 [Vigna angularis]KAG2406767.1 uncharacterized protein HKW66_Vig0060240 [Vigna angularis]BAT86504.1 hypothetical protein VIGAN_04416100 [Vigna angularis var. angularis]
MSPKYQTPPKYQTLDNRPVNQWKVTELREELRRRRLNTKGLKDDLVKRLDECLRLEREGEQDSEKEEANGFDDVHVDGEKGSAAVTMDAEVVDATDKESTQTFETAEKGKSDVVEPIETENEEMFPGVVDEDSNKNDKQDDITGQVDINNSVSTMDEEVEHEGFPSGVYSGNVVEEVASTHASAVETTITVTESVVTGLVVSGEDSYCAEKNNEFSAAKLENEESKAQLDGEDTKPQLDSETKPLHEDIVPDSSVPENQVSEVNPSLGSQVKSDSISTDSVSINQKNELKDTIITDNVKLEQDIVKPEMVEEPSSRNDVPVSYDVPVGGRHEKKTSVEENINNVSSPDLNKTNSSDDVGYPEKLNLDRSSGDDSMEEDLPETKQIDSKFNVDELRKKVESIEEPIVKEESRTIAVGDGVSGGKNDTHQDIDISPVAPTEKRKFHEQTSVGNNEPAKRQRRWNTETVKSPDSQSTTPRPATTPREEPIPQKRNLSRSDSSATDDTPKERIVPPSPRSPTNSLRIDRFLRPFTLKAVQELLGKTGNVSSFWMDQIKTHCYVTYSSVEEAMETRNAVYNLQWPPNGGRLLVAEYVDPEEVKMKLESPVQTAPISTAPVVPPVVPTSQPEPSPRLHREQHSVPTMLPPPPPLSKNPPVARDRLPSPPPLPEKVDPPIVTLDDLFRKTISTPRIYYLPLSEEQVAAKLAAQGKSVRQ